jgi:hypothetical protein
MTKPDLEKRCINKTFPQIVTVEEDKCPNPKCKGYDRHCLQYVPTGSFKLHEIEEMLNHLENQPQLPPQNSQKGGTY